MCVIQKIALVFAIIFRPIKSLFWIISTIKIFGIELSSKKITNLRDLKKCLKIHQKKMGLSNIKIIPELNDDIKRSTSDVIERGKKYKIMLKPKGFAKNSESTLVHELFHIKNGDLDSLTDKQLNIGRKAKSQFKDLSVLIELNKLNIDFDIKINHQIKQYWVGNNWV